MVTPVALPVWVKLRVFAASSPVPGTNCRFMHPGVEAAECHSVPQRLRLGLDWLALTVATVLFTKENRDTSDEVQILPEDVTDRAVFVESMNHAPVKFASCEEGTFAVPSRFG